MSKKSDSTPGRRMKRKPFPGLWAFNQCERTTTHYRRYKHGKFLPPPYLSGVHWNNYYIVTTR